MQEQIHSGAVRASFVRLGCEGGVMERRSNSVHLHRLDERNIRHAQVADLEDYGNSRVFPLDHLPQGA